MSRRILSLCLLITTICGPILSLPADAQVLKLDSGFDPNHVLDDADVFDATAMNYDGLVNFLKSKGTLGRTSATDIDGVTKPIAQIIWRISTSYKMNPKYLLALIQKEQSLVDDPAPSQKQFDWATGYGVCDNCRKDDPSIQEFKGFASQLEWAAKQHREKYLMQLLGNGQTRAGKAPGKPMTVDGMLVTPTNNATAMLYSYTPHIHGNLNLWRIWRRWFSLVYPDGTVAKAKHSGKTYLLRMGEKRQFASRSVLESLVDPAKVITVADTTLSTYPDGAMIRFPKYALLRDEDQNIWLLTGSSRRRIADMKTFRKFGFNEDEVEDVENEDITDYPIEDPITLKTEFPQGVVLQDKTDKSYWYVEDNIKHAIPAKAFLKLYFSGRQIQLATTKKLSSYTTGDAYALHDAELVRGTKSPSVYVVENGVLRPIPSAEIFETLGWSWKNVVVLPDSVLLTYHVGEPFTPHASDSSQTVLTHATTSSTTSTTL